jgi:phage terminase large subunit
MKLEASIPAKLGFLFEPHRYKVAYGGRGSGKSHSFAIALLTIAASRKVRVLCTREIQKSIRDSVHRLLSDQIERMGLQSHFRVLDTEIRGKNGSEFLFTGLSNQTADSVKSFEGVDIAWCEEAQSISKRSWDVLIPTIRKEGSEIWVSFNPDLDSDDTYQRFVVHPPPDTVSVLINWRDNPWFPKVLNDEREHAKRSNPEDYGNIWEGTCKSAIAGAIYAKEMDYARENRLIRPVPHDPSLPVQCIWDLGWNDAMAIVFVQKAASELRVIDYLEDSFQTLDWYVRETERRGYKIAEDWIPHDGTHRDFKTGKSTKEILEGFGRTVEVIPNVSVEDGIRTARMVFKRCYFDEVKTEKLVECLRRYRRSINAQTGEPGAPLHDVFSHGADGFRYLGVVAELLGKALQRTAHPIFATHHIGRQPATMAGY